MLYVHVRINHRDSHGSFFFLVKHANKNCVVLWICMYMCVGHAVALILSVYGTTPRPMLNVLTYHYKHINNIINNSPIQCLYLKGSIRGQGNSHNTSCGGLFKFHSHRRYGLFFSDCVNEVLREPLAKGCWVYLDMGQMQRMHWPWYPWIFSTSMLRKLRKIPPKGCWA